MAVSKSPTAQDTIENRMKEFTRCAISEFIVCADYQICSANDKNSIKAKNGFSKYIGKTAEYATAATVFGLTGGLGPSKLAGKVAG